MARVKLGDVARERKETCKGSKDGYPTVGLEHLIPEEINLTQWSEDSENTFTKLFRKGDVLFGRRRAYLKKAAVAPFDGICSGDITVIEAMPDRILPELLPFVIQNDALFDFAVGKSAGSLSPRVKWEHLKNYEFELPSPSTQRRLADILWAMNDTRTAYQELIAATDELVKSQFIELTQMGESIKGWEKEKLKHVCDFYSGTGFPNEYQGEKEGEYPFYKVSDISNNVIHGNKHLRYCENYITEETCTIIKGKRIPPDTIVFAKIGEALKLNRRAITDRVCLIDNNVMGIRPKPESLNTDYFFCFMQGIDMAMYSGATTMPSVRKTVLEEVEICIPPIDVQRQFADFVQQSDKSKFAAQIALNQNSHWSRCTPM